MITNEFFPFFVVTGGLGQLGVGLARFLRSELGNLLCV